MIVGPGLPAFTDADSVPSVVASAIDGASGMGARFFRSEADQSTCDYMTSIAGVPQVLKNASSVVLDR
eukprot:SAG31_NODE_245_length_19224_cov_10.210614_10_plen_68_part_00